VNYYEAILASMNGQSPPEEADEINRDRIEEFMQLLCGQLGVVVESGYDITMLKFEIKAVKDTSPHPLAIELELSWPENE